MAEMLGGLMLNRIYQMDCLEGMKLIPDKSIDMILCDLPYGTTACKWDTVIPFEPLWEQYERIIKDNGAIVLFGSQPFTTDLINSNRKLFKYELVWDKQVGTDFQLANVKPMKAHENIIVFGKGKLLYNPQKVKRDKPLKTDNWNKEIVKTDNYNMGSKQRTRGTYTEKYPTSIVSFNCFMEECNNPKRVHPTQKPVALFEWLIKTYTNEGDVVLDNCMGSGTTAVAALKCGRKFIGFETEPKYVEIANQRIESVYNELDDQKLIDKME